MMTATDTGASSYLEWLAEIMNREQDIRPQRFHTMMRGALNATQKSGLSATRKLQEAIAEEFGVEVMQVRHWMYGSLCPPPDTFRDILRKVHAHLSAAEA